MSAANTYFDEITKIPLMSKEIEIEVARKAKAGDLAARAKLIYSNLRFVVKIAHQYRDRGVSLEDLIQEGNMGMMRALKLFDPEKGIRFISYAVNWIRSMMGNRVMADRSLVKIGTTQLERTLFHLLPRLKQELHRLGKEETAENVIQIIGPKLKPERIKPILDRLSSPDCSIDDESGIGKDDGKPLSMHGLLPTDQPDPAELAEVLIEQSQIIESVQQAMEILDQRERFIIENRYFADPPLTLKKLGAHFGFSRERARQLEVRAYKKLRRLLRRAV